MAKQNPTALINYYAKRFGVDPRAARAVASVEGGLKWGAVGDQGTSFGPFQLHVGGALPRGRNAAWANSGAGIKYAMRKIAGVSRGMTGRRAVTNIVRRFERPAAPGAEIERAMDVYGIGGNSVARGNNLSFGDTNPAPAGGSGRTELLQAIMAQNTAFATGTPVDPSLMVNALRVSHSPAEAVGGPGGPGGPGGVGVTPGGKGGTALGAIIDSMNRAKKLGLRVSENPYVDKVDPVHVSGSDHYKNLGKRGGRQVGSAFDASGSPAAMKKLFNYIVKRYGKTAAKDLFYTPMKYSLDEGNKTSYLQSGHDTHVHASFGR